MSGSASTLLSAWVTPTTIYPAWDHTYVVSDCGWVWRCWGASSGGSSLRSASGNSFVANCLSEPLGTAEIAYGGTGVCHQTANRILFATYDPTSKSAAIRANGARGYNVSENIWGHYGADPWLNQWRCHQFASGGGDPVDHDQIDDQLTLKRKALAMPESYRSDVSTKMHFDEGEQRRAIREMVASSLVSPLSDGEERLMLEIRFWMRREQITLWQRMKHHDLTAESYLQDMDDTVRAAMKRNRRVLGDDRFMAIYGEAGNDPSGLIHRETFLATHAS